MLNVPLVKSSLIRFRYMRIGFDRYLAQLETLPSASKANGGIASFFKLSFLIILSSVCISCSSSSDSTFGGILSNTDGGTGYASIAINSYSPARSTVVVKKENTETFFVAAVGQGNLTYKWTLDGETVGVSSATYSLNAANVSVGLKTLKVLITDSLGSVSQQWTVKINGTPVVDSTSPSVTTVGVRRATNAVFSVSVSDPNSDTLTYVWKLDGNEDVLTASGSSATYSPTALEVGAHTVAVDIYDGDTSDSGTYKLSRSWAVNVNNFYTGCNDMANQALTNRTCVYVGIAGVGGGLNPLTQASSIFVHPTALAYASNGNLFFADTDLDVVYYWNKTASLVTVVGVDVPANTIKAVAGVGVGATAAALPSGSSKALRVSLNNPTGLYFDGTDLYISGSANNLVRKVDSTNTITNILGGGTSNTDGVAATGTGASAHICTTPYGVVKSGDDLFVACSGNNRVKRVDLTSGLAYTFAGNGGTAAPTSNAASTPTNGTNGTLNLPYGLTLDSSGNLYISEYTGCRIRVVNRTAASINFFGTWAVGAGLMRTIVGDPLSNACSYVSGEAVNLTAAADARVHNPRHINIDSTGGKLLIAQHSNHSIALLNLSGSNLTYGTTTVNSYYSTRIIGNGSGGFIGDGAFADATKFNTPYEAAFDPNTNDIMVADYANLRLRQVNSSNHRTDLIAGNGSAARLATAGNIDLEVNLEKLNSPRHIAYDSVNGDLFIPDYTNQRIRKVDKYGKSTLVLGSGTTGAGAEEDEYPTSITLNNPSAIALIGATTTPAFGGHVIFTDSTNHRIRFWNRGTANVTYFGVTINAGKVSTVAGTGVSGNDVTGSAVAAMLKNPHGIATDGTNLYIADTGNNCVKKVDSSGTISAVAGACGAAGAFANGPVGTAKMNSPQGITYFESGANKGLFIGDVTNSRVRFTRIAGTTAIAGIPVSIGDTNTVACGGAYHDDSIIASNASCNGVYGVAIVGNRFCFVNYGYHNIRCVDISTGIITTVMGPLQGADVVGKYFPATTFDITSQDNVMAASGTADPALTDSFGQLARPMGLTSNGTNTLFVSEWSAGIIRKIILAP
jgi:hypothetical protein